MKRSFARSPYLWAMLGVAAVVTAAWVGRENYQPVLPGSLAPDFVVTAMDGSLATVEQYRGKVVLLNFWATWCGPCKIEIPWFVEFAEQHKDDGLVVLGLSIDDTAAKIQAFAEEYNVNYPMLVGLGREDFQEAYGPVWGIPMTFFIDREGTLCRTHTGIANREEFEKDIADLL